MREAKTFGEDSGRRLVRWWRTVPRRPKVRADEVGDALIQEEALNGKARDVVGGERYGPREEPIEEAAPSIYASGD